MQTNITRDTPTIYADTVYRTSLLARWAYYFNMIGCPAEGVFQDEVVVGFQQYQGRGSIEIQVGAHSRDFSDAPSPSGFLIKARGLPGPHSNKAFEDGKEICGACFTWYGYTRKQWTDPFWDEDGITSCEESLSAAAYAEDAPVISGILVPHVYASFPLQPA